MYSWSCSDHDAMVLMRKWWLSALMTLRERSSRCRSSWSAGRVMILAAAGKPPGASARQTSPKPPADELLRLVAAGQVWHVVVRRRGAGRLGRCGGGGGVLRHDGGDRVLLQQLLEAVELAGEAFAVHGHFRLVAVAAADAVLLVDQLRRQRPGRAQLGVQRDVEFERPALLAPPTDLEVGGDQLQQDGGAQRVAGRRQELREVDVLGTVPRAFEAVGQILQAAPVLGVQGNASGGNQPIIFAMFAIL